MNHLKKLITISLCILLAGCHRTVTPSNTGSTNEPVTTASAQTTEEPAIAEDTTCDDKACVALYLYTYEHLPANYMTKKEARELGWEGGALHLVVEGMCIGGDVYGNYEGTLPEEDSYHECDIDTLNAKKRGAKRIVYSQDGDIWYTEDHYETFELLYGEDAS